MSSRILVVVTSIVLVVVAMVVVVDVVYTMVFLCAQRGPVVLCKSDDPWR